MAELQGKILKRLRQEKGWTQKDLAQIMQRAESTIGMWEQGRREMDYDSLKQAADIFSVSIDYLLGRNLENKAKNEIQEIILDDFQYALYGEVKDLTDEEKQDILDMIKIFNATEKSGSNRRRRYYRCQYNNSHFAEHKTCSFTSMENTSLEKLFLEYLENLELNLSAVDEMESSQQSDVEKAEAVMNELISRKERLRGRRDKLLEKYLDGIIDDETYMTTAAVIDDELAEIEDRIQNLEAEIHPREKINYSLESLKSHLQQSHSSIREMWALLSNDEKRMFVTTLVKKMYIAKGRIVSIIFN